MNRNCLYLRLLPLAALLSCCAIYRVYKKMQRKRSRRSCWSRKWLLNRDRRGTLALLHELHNEDPCAYRNFLRINDKQFKLLLHLIETDIKREDTFMRQCISAKHRLDVTLRYLATGETYRSLMYSTRIHESTISKIVPETCTAIYKHLREKYLKTPSTSEEWLEIAAEFEKMWNFPHCLGALDGRHITFCAPISSGSFYFNYKGSNSIVLLGLVDANHRFIYANVGVNGRVSDGGVFDSCLLAKRLYDKTLSLPEPTPLPGRIEKIPYVIIADDAFPLLENVMKPFPQRGLTHENRIYNYRLSRARRMVESGFGILVNRWRVLLNPIHLSADKVEKITMACIVLHNFLTVETSKYAQEMDKQDIENLQLSQITRQGGHKSKGSARRIREEFKEYFNSAIGAVPWQDEAVQKGNW